MMGKAAAKQGDQVIAMDVHVVTTLPGAPIALKLAAASPVTLPFKGVISEEVSDNVYIMGERAAVEGSIAINRPKHVAPTGDFIIPPANSGEIVSGSRTVFINGERAARDGDKVKTCNDPVPLDVGKVVVAGGATVYIG